MWGLLMGATLGLGAGVASADEAGVSFWLPGTYGSLAAVPGEPGWSVASSYYHVSADASASKVFPIGATLAAGLDAKSNLLLVTPTYVFSRPVFGGQAATNITGVYGRSEIETDATLTGPGGGILTRSQGDSLTAFGDLYPSVSLRWQEGNHNFLGYTMFGIPVGSYDVNRLANLGINHWSIDIGGGYTYLSQQSGHELSAVAGLTYNFENPDTHYQNGVDAHLDWAASQFLSASWHVGLVGYFYHQLTGDSGSGAVLGDFKSQVSAIGPQVGYIFPVGGKKTYVNLKGYYEFDAKHRVEGWNLWLTLAMPLGSARQ